MRRKQKIIGAIVLIASLLMGVSPVAAHQSPGGCNSNRLTLSLAKDKTTVQNGDTITYTVTLSNVDMSPLLACDITNATTVVTLPSANGTSSGTQVTIASNQNYVAGTAFFVVDTVQYVVNVNPGVTDVVAKVEINGTLHDAPVDHSAQVIKTIGTAVVTPPEETPPGQTPGLPGLPNAGIVKK